MPKIPIDECPAGPAMDAAVAEALIGHAFNGTGEIENRDGTVSEFCKVCDKPKGYHRYACYSNDIAAAWELWYQLAKRFFWIEVCTIENLKSRAAFYHDIDPKVTRPIEAFGKTVPLAICRAFLKANGVEFVETTE